MRGYSKKGQIKHALNADKTLLEVEYKPCELFTFRCHRGKHGGQESLPGYPMACIAP